MGRRDLTGWILQNIRIGSLQNPGRTATKPRCMLAESLASSASLDPNQFNVFVFKKVVEDADRVRSPANAGKDGVWKLAFGFADLGAGLASNDAMEVANHGWIGMRSEHAAEQVMRCANVSDPVAHSFVDGVFERARSRIDSANLGSE